MVTVHLLVAGGPPEVREVWPVDAREYLAQGWLAGPPSDAVVVPAPLPTAAAAAAWLGERAKKDLVALAEKCGLPTSGTKDALVEALLLQVLAGTLSIEAVNLLPPPLPTGFTPH